MKKISNIEWGILNNVYIINTNIIRKDNITIITKNKKEKTIITLTLIFKDCQETHWTPQKMRRSFQSSLPFARWPDSRDSKIVSYERSSSTRESKEQPHRDYSKKMIVKKKRELFPGDLPTSQGSTCVATIFCFSIPICDYYMLYISYYCFYNIKNTQKINILNNNKEHYFFIYII